MIKKGKCPHNCEYKKEIGELNEKILHQQNEIANYQNEQQRMVLDIKEHKFNDPTYIEKAVKLESQVRFLQNKLDRAKSQLFEYEKTIEEQSRQINRLDKINSEIETETILNEKWNDLNIKVSEMNRTLKFKESILAKMNEKIASFKESIAKDTDDLNDVRKTYNDILKNIKKKQKELNKLETEKSKELARKKENKEGETSND